MTTFLVLTNFLLSSYVIYAVLFNVSPDKLKRLALINFYIAIVNAIYTLIFWL